MKKIGCEVLFLATSKENPRNGEGAFIRLKNGNIMFAYSEYLGESWGDHCNAQITAYISTDEGETWGDKQVIYRKNDSDKNLMSVSFKRMQNGDIGVFFLRKDADLNCRLHIIRSSDEGKTWSEPVLCIAEQGYYVTNNDRVIRLSDGKLLFPANYHKYSDTENYSVAGRCEEVFFYESDDDGYTWSRAGSVRCPFLESNSITGLHESGLYELADGRVMCYSRTDLGTQYFCYSSDKGKTWTTPQPNKFFTCPASPLLIKDAGKYTFGIFNPIPEYTGREGMDRTWGRTPYVCAVSLDKANTFSKVFLLEDDLTNSYCYPAIIEGDGYFLVAYYHSNNTGVPLNSTKITKVMYDEIENV